MVEGAIAFPPYRALTSTIKKRPVLSEAFWLEQLLYEATGISRFSKPEMAASSMSSWKGLPK
jgi:hypothetical protein